MPMNILQSRKFSILLFLILFAFTLAGNLYCALYKTSFFLHNDGTEYLELAESFAKYGSLVSETPRYYETMRSYPIPEPFRIQLISTFTGVLIACGIPPLPAAAILQAIAGATAGFLLYAIGSALSSKSTGLFMLCAFLFHPLIAQYLFQFCGETLCMCFLLCFFRCVLLHESAIKYVLAAIFLTAAAYCRAAVFLYFPFLALALAGYYFHTSPRMLRFRFQTYRYLFLFTVTACFLAFPVGLRNLHSFGTFSITGFEGGFSFFHGNNRYAVNAYKANSWQEFLQEDKKKWDYTFDTIRALPASYSGHPEKQAALMRNMAFRELKGMTFSEKWTLYSGKLIHFLQPNPKTLLSGYPLFIFLTVSISFYYIGGISGLFLMFRKGQTSLAAALLLLAICGTVAHVMFVVLMRYRVPFIDLPCVIASGFLINSFFQGLKRRFHFAR